METSTRLLAGLKQAIVCKRTETDKARGELEVAQEKADLVNGRQRELLRDIEKKSRELREERAEGRRRAAAMVALQKKGPTRLTEMLGAIAAMEKKMTGARAEIQKWKDRRGRAVDEHQRLLAVRKETACRANAEHRALEEQGRRLDGRLRQLSCQFAEVRKRRRRLADVTNAATDQLVGYTDAMRRLERRLSHECLVLAMKRTMAEGDKAVFEMHETVKGLQMTMMENRLDELRTAICPRAEAGRTPSDVTYRGDVACAC